MLPGFRFLFVTTVMSAAVLIFAVGAAALLRASFDSFATFPSRRTPQEQVFVKRSSGPDMPTIALLRVEPEAERAAEPVPAPAADPAVAPASEPVSAQTNSMQTTPIQANPAQATPAQTNPIQTNLAALDIPEPPAPVVIDLDTLRREVMQESAVAAAAQPVPVVAPDPNGESTQAASPEITASLTPAVDDGARLATETRKTAEAAKARLRKLEAARRTREARLAAQRRRVAAARARAARPAQTQAPALFNPVVGTN